jgi:hypothetical protein
MAPPALGIPPEEIVEPFTIMLCVTSAQIDEWIKGTGAEKM